MSKKNSRKTIRKTNRHANQYQSLEQRRLLATSAVFNAGSLIVDFSAANDVGVVDVDGSGNVTVNGSDQIDVGGSNTTVAANSVMSFISNGTSDVGQELTLEADFPALDDITTSDVDHIAIEGSYDIDSFYIVGATEVVQDLGSTLTVALDSVVEAIGDVSLASTTNDFAGLITPTGDNIFLYDINELSLGPVAASGNFEIEVGSVTALLAPIVVGGDTSITFEDEVTFLMSPIDTNNLTIFTTNDASNISLSSIFAGGNADITGGTITGIGTWNIAGNTTVTSIGLRSLQTDAVNLADADVTTTDFTVSGPNSDVVIGDSTVSGDSSIDGLRVQIEQSNNANSGGGAASSNQGGATFSVNGDTSITAQGSIEADNATVNSQDLTIESAFNDVILGTATTVTGDLSITAGGLVETGSVTVLGSADIDSVGDITTNLVADGNSRLETESNIYLEGLGSNSATLVADGDITNLPDAVIDIQNNLWITASSAVVGDMPNDSVTVTRMTANVDNDLTIEQESNARLLNVSATDLSVTSTGTITNRNDATIDVSGDAQFSGTNIIIGQTAADTFNAGRLNFNASNSVLVSEDSDTEIFGINAARSIDIKSSGDITDDDNAITDVAFATIFEGQNVTIGDTATDNFQSRTLTFTSPGHVDVAQDSRVFLINDSASDQLTLSSTVSILDSPTSQVDIAGEASFITPYMNIGEVVTDSFNAGSISLNQSDTVNITENSDTVFSGDSDVRLAIIRSDGSMSNAADASFEATSVWFTVDGDITLGTQTGDYFDLDRIRFNSPADVTFDQDDSLYFYGQNTADNLHLIADGAIGDSGTASFTVLSNTRFEGTAVWIGEQTTDTFNTGTLTILATGNVIIEENSLMLLEGSNTAFNLTLTADGVIADDDNAELTVQKFATFTADTVIIGDTATDCFEIIDGASQLLVNATTSNVVVSC